MTKQPISIAEIAALGVAALLHALLGLALWFQPDTREPVPPVERVTVNLSEEVGLQAAAPDPVPESRAAIAPTLSENPAPVFVPSEIIPAPRTAPTAAPRAQTPPRARPTARPTARATRAPAPRATRTPPPRATDNSPRRRPDRQDSRPAQRSGGSQIGDNFLQGAGSSTTTAETRVPASQIGASAKASLLQALSRQLKPHWTPPDGPEVDRIVSRVSFSLNPDGSLSGAPRLRGQTGVNATNRAQAARHGEQAIRAVQLAAPFDLPDQFYEGWKRATMSFDWKLAQ